MSVFLNRWATLPNLHYLAGDTANIASFAVAIDHDGFFDKDPVLGNKEHFAWYIPAYLGLIRSLTRLFNGNIYLAFWSQIDVCMFFFALGCYLFGRDFIGSRKYGIFFLLLNLAFIPCTVGGGWGIPLNMTRPFILFIGFLPLTLWAGWKIREKKYGYPLYFIMLSSMVFIHPPSAIFWVFAQWWTGWLMLNKKFGIRQLIINQMMAACIIVSIILPYMVVFSSRFLTSSSPLIDYDRIMSIAHYRLHPLLFCPLGYPYNVWKEYPIALKIIALASPFMTMYLIRRKILIQTGICMVWTASFFFLGTCIAALQFFICDFLKLPPYSYDFPRSYMFIPFILYAITLMFLKAIENHIENRPFAKKVFLSAVSLFIISWLGFLYFPQTIAPTLRSFSRNEFIPRPITRHNDFMSTLAKTVTLPRETIASFPGGTSELCIRYDAKRPLLYCYKDGGILMFDNLEKAQSWHQISQKRRELQTFFTSQHTPTEKGTALINWAKSLEAEFLTVSGYENTIIDFSDLRTTQCHGLTIVNLKNEANADTNSLSYNHLSPNIKPKGKIIDLLNPQSYPDWLQKSSYSTKPASNLSFTNRTEIILDNTNEELCYSIQASPCNIYLLSFDLYYEQISSDFKISLGYWKAKLYGNRAFEDINSVLSDQKEWKKYEILILVPPEIRHDALNIQLHLVRLRGNGLVKIKSPILQYLEKFPLPDGL